jgi:hypothetical protein
MQIETWSVRDIVPMIPRPRSHRRKQTLHSLANIPANFAPFSPDRATFHTTFPTRSTALRTSNPAALSPFCSSDAPLHTPFGSGWRRRNYDGGLSLGWPDRKLGRRDADCDQPEH